MKYYVQRQLHEYGPYTLADLQRYVAQGNILLTDLTRSEGMTEWMPVSQVIGNIPIPVTVPPPAPAGVTYGSVSAHSATGTVYGGAAAYARPASAPLTGATAPPDFHWALLLVISVVTFSLFAWVWLFVQAAFIRKLRPESKGLLFALLAVIAIIGSFFLNAVSSPETRAEGNPIVGLLILGGFLLCWISLFLMQKDLEEYYNAVEPIQLYLNGFMTFFCGIFYFQYHFSRICEWKRTGYLAPQG
jgi:uncharacterized protein DUF4339